MVLNADTSPTFVLTANSSNSTNSTNSTGSEEEVWGVGGGVQVLMLRLGLQDHGSSERHPVNPKL